MLMNIEMKNVDIEKRENIYELFYRILAQIPIVITVVVSYIIEYVMTVINIVYGPIIQWRYSSLKNKIILKDNS